MTDELALLVDIAVWVVWGFVVGYAAHRLPDRAIDHDTVVTAVRRPDSLLRFCDRTLRIKRWKGRLPEAGDAFEGGFSKKHLRSGRREHLEQFVRETRRAEYTHLANLAIVPVFFIWNAWWLAVVMVAYGVIANVPFWIAQRYNRVRLQRIISRLDRRTVGVVELESSQSEVDAGLGQLHRHPVGDGEGERPEDLFEAVHQPIASEGGRNQWPDLVEHHLLGAARADQHHRDGERDNTSNRPLSHVVGRLDDRSHQPSPDSPPHGSAVRC